MEFKYTITQKGRKNCYFLVSGLYITDASEDIMNVAIGKTPNLFLEQLYVWGNNFSVNISLVGCTEIINILAILEETLKEHIPKDRERTYVRLLYPDGHFGWIEYDTEEDRLRIIKDHLGMFGTRVDMTSRELKKVIKKNRFTLDVSI